MVGLRFGGAEKYPRTTVDGRGGSQATRQGVSSMRQKLACIPVRPAEPGVREVHHYKLVLRAPRAFEGGGLIPKLPYGGGGVVVVWEVWT